MNLICNMGWNLEDYTSKIITTSPRGQWVKPLGRVTHICVRKLTIIGSDNGLSPGQRQAIIGTNAGILLIEPLENKLQWNFNRNSYIFIKK